MNTVVLVVSIVLLVLVGLPLLVWGLMALGLLDWLKKTTKGGYCLLPTNQCKKVDNKDQCFLVGDYYSSKDACEGAKNKTSMANYAAF